MADTIADLLVEIKATCDKISAELTEIQKDKAVARMLLEEEKRRSAALLRENRDMEEALDASGVSVSECDCGHLVLMEKANTPDCPYCPEKKTEAQIRADGIREIREDHWRDYQEKERG